MFRTDDVSCVKNYSSLRGDPQLDCDVRVFASGSCICRALMC